MMMLYQIDHQWHYPLPHISETLHSNIVVVFHESRSLLGGGAHSE